MKDQFVTYEIAKKLKELGFDEPCCGFYLISSLYSMERWGNSTSISRNTMLAPLWQQAVTFINSELTKRGFVLELIAFTGLDNIEATMLKALELITNKS